MLKNSEQITVLCGIMPESSNDIYPMPVFSEEVCSFLHQLSSMLMKHPESRMFPDILTFGFFCRRANINRLKSQYNGNIENRLGRGITFHIAPSNVPVNFAYSMAVGLLAGNACIIKVSSKPFPQTDIVCSCINELLAKKENHFLNNYISVVRYPNEEAINDAVSSICDVRIIWGGDNTISEIRKSPLPSRATEITFADRYSVAVFDAEAVLNADTSFARDFYNDTYLYDQNACSSPHLIYWLGEKDVCDRASQYFWNTVHDYIKSIYHLSPVLAVDKYTAACRIAISQKTEIVSMPDMLISRVRIYELSEDIEKYRCAGGSFTEYYDTTLDALEKIVSRKTQTISYFGDIGETLREYVTGHHLTGVDRIVPVGRTADFDVNWDGYDLILQLSRYIALQKKGMN